MAGKPRINEAEWPSIISRYEAGEGCSAIGADYGVKHEAIYRVIRRCGGVIKRCGGAPETPTEVADRMVEQYQAGKGATTIAREMGVDKRTVYNVLNRRGVGTRPRSDRVGGDLAVRQKQRPEGKGHQRGPRVPFREDAFAVLNDECAYWLGYLITDGCVHHDVHMGRTPTLTLRQSRAHREVCEQLRAFLQCELPVRDYECVTFGKNRLFSSFTVSSQRVFDDLARWGIHPAKTGRVEAAAELQDNPQFWRGVIEGDGSVWADKIAMNSSSARLAAQFRRFVRRRVPALRLGVYRNQAGVWMLHTAKGEESGELAASLYPEGVRVGVSGKIERAQQLKKKRGQSVSPDPSLSS